jgi:hypothetical protein
LIVTREVLPRLSSNKLFDDQPLATSRFGCP